MEYILFRDVFSVGGFSGNFGLMLLSRYCSLIKFTTSVGIKLLKRNYDRLLLTILFSFLSAIKG